MSTPAASEMTAVVPFGVDASSGSYYGEPVLPAAIADAALAGVLPPEETKALQERIDAMQANFDVREGINPEDLAEAGWGIVFTHDCPQEVIDALAPLRELRKQQAGDLYREFTRAKGYRPLETAQRFIVRNGAAPGPVDPQKMPYYLLLVGSPEKIPFSFQYSLDVQHSVGRLWFENVADYERYAASVVEQETAPASGRRALVFSACNPGDAPTNLSTTELVEPLLGKLRSNSSGWEIDPLLADDATKKRISESLHSETAPRLLLSVTHGVGFPNGDPLQIAHQGALLCQDWPGPQAHRGAIPQDWYFAGDDLDSSAKVRGMIAMLFACYGAGTPRRDYFPEKSKVGPRDIAPHNFIAGLPQRMLSHPGGSALAVIGHVERAWSYSFVWPRAGQQTGIFEDTLKMLMKGRRVGCAMEHFGQRYAELGTELSEVYDMLRQDPSLKPDPVEFANMWTARNDARSFIIIGDPAARLT